VKHSEYREKGFRFYRMSVEDTDVRDDVAPEATQLYAYMLMQDIHNHVVPYGPRPLGPRVRIEPDDPEVNAMVARAVSANGSDRLEFSIPEFIRQCAGELAIFGRSIREIAYWTSPDAKRASAFRLLHLLPQQVLWKRGKPVQRLSDKAAAVAGKRYVELPAADLLTFEWPCDKYGKHSDMIQRVRLLSITSHPNFLIPDPRQPGGVVPVNVSEFTKTVYSALVEATRALGWNARHLISEYQTDYHSLYRQLRFERFNIDLRTRILATLNTGLARAGERVGFSAKISVEGAPSEADVEDAERRLAEGNHTFKEIMAPFWSV
jgi:hypothetical protein